MDSLTHQDDTQRHKDSLTHHDDTPGHKDSLTHQDSLTQTLHGKAGLLETKPLGYQNSLSYLTVNCKVKGGLQGVVHLLLASSSRGCLYTADHCQHTHKALPITANTHTKHCRSLPTHTQNTADHCQHTHTKHCRSLPTHTQSTCNCTLPTTANTHKARTTVHCRPLPTHTYTCLLYTSPSPRDQLSSRMPSSA